MTRSVTSRSANSAERGENRMATKYYMLKCLSELVAEWDADHAGETYRTGLTPDTNGIEWAREILAKDDILKGGTE